MAKQKEGRKPEPSAKQRANWARFAKMARARREAAKKAAEPAPRPRRRQKAPTMAKKTETPTRRRPRGFNLRNPDAAVRTLTGAAGVAILLEPVVRDTLYPGAPVGNYSPSYYRPPTSIGEGVGRSIGALKNSAKGGQIVAALLPSLVGELVIGGKRMVKRAVAG